MRLLLDFRGPFVSDWRDQMCRDNAMLSYSPKDIFSEYLSRQLHLLNALDNNYSTWDRWGDTHNFLGHAAELSKGRVALVGRPVSLDYHTSTGNCCSYGSRQMTNKFCSFR